ncbi:CMP dCMP deaminase zinc-binding protein [Secundilactobacillus odoratitofui DSM 19909 = JCM 15043]|uniref:tRNA-specific adenosine deaminase n=1 Tax=Secundilactobacillus odoratitofui DSM 19909 = JCM 15043 TaxID=1423776 RepID=A0A0R1M6R2_9LACO|nr:tRNA adenosine(34) deaminase TadA [Secundilactobacillus odoratitofui]KRK99938.1 CMP dCMP deaminase zinc-binding protein [Secundilactobacillus odoratitofui DSM 19909 = JCM 15043]
MSKIDEKFMRAALLEAKKAALIGEVPIGAVVVHDNEIIGRGHNLREHSQLAVDHAEMMAIEEANQVLNSWRLVDCTLYVTLEPCIMCSGGIVNSRLKRVVFGARDPKAGAVSTLYRLLNDQRLNHQVEVTEGVLAADASQQLKAFFKAARKRRKLQKQQSKRLDQQKSIN